MIFISDLEDHLNFYVKRDDGARVYIRSMSNGSIAISEEGCSGVVIPKKDAEKVGSALIAAAEHIAWAERYKRDVEALERERKQLKGELQALGKY